MSPNYSRILLIAALCAGPTTAQIRWVSSLDEAQATSRAENRPLVVVTHLTNARGAMQMTAEHFKDRDLGRLAAESRNVFIDLQFETDSRRAPRRRGPRLPKALSPADSAAVDTLLKVPDGRFLQAPQYVFLSPDGEVIVSVAGRVTSGELEWMWNEALRKTLPQWSHPLSEAARAPRTVKFGEITTWDGSSLPPNEQEVAEMLDDLKKMRNIRGAAALRLTGLLRTHDEKAMSYIGANLRGRSWVRGMTLRSIEQLSPRVWYEVVTPVLESNSDDGRRLAAQALESLAHPKALPALKKRWPNEGNEEVQGALLQAMAASGPKDRKVMSVLEKTFQHSKSEDLRAQAVLAIGLLERRDCRERNLSNALLDGSAKIRSAAAFTIAWRRDRALIATLETAVTTEGDAEVVERLEAALNAVAANGGLAELEAYYRQHLGGDRDLLNQLRGLGDLLGGSGRGGGKGGEKGGKGTGGKGQGGEAGPGGAKGPGKGEPKKGAGR